MTYSSCPATLSDRIVVELLGMEQIFSGQIDQYDEPSTMAAVMFLAVSCHL